MKKNDQLRNNQISSQLIFEKEPKKKFGWRINNKWCWNNWIYPVKNNLDTDEYFSKINYRSKCQIKIYKSFRR
jgi:hypothetical protein